jgi:putative transcription factor
MTSCELCGKPATTRARVEGVLFSVCASCSALGVEVKAKPAPAARPSFRPAFKERFVAQDFGFRIRQARQRRGLTEKDAAQLLAIKESTLLNLEAGKMQPDDALLRKLEKFYGLSLSESV